MSDYETKDNTGALFNNDAYKKTDKHPDYTGNAVINGKKLSIGAWVNEAKSGKKYMSLKFSEFKPQENSVNTSTTTAPDFEESVPF